MLSSHELGWLAAVSHSRTVEGFLNETILRSRATKTQQLRVYGFWQRVPAQKPEVRPSLVVGDCEEDHYNETCAICDRGWGNHAGHQCADGGNGIFPGCGVDV